MARVDEAFRRRAASLVLVVAMVGASFPARGFHDDLHDTSAGEDPIVYGTVGGGGLGDAVAVGNLDNDGEELADLLILQAGNGRLHVIFDSPLAHAEWADGLTEAALPVPDVTIELGSEGGQVLATYRNSEGFDDVVVTNGDQTAFLFSVPTEPGTYTLDGVNPVTITVEGTIEAIAAGNIDGSGADELAFGNPSIDSVWVHETTGELSQLIGVQGPTGSSFGSSLAIGELNDPLDEPGDLVVGAPSGGEFGEGFAYTYFDPITVDGGLINVGEFDVAFTGSSSSGIGEALGTAVAVGDVTGDDVDDVVVGAPFAEDGLGAVYVVEGLLAGEVEVHPIGDVAAPTISDEQSLRIGSRLALGDVIVDGIDDVLIGGRASDPHMLVATGGTELGSNIFTFTDGIATSQFGASFAVSDGGWMAIGAPSSDAFEPETPTGSVTLIAAEPAPALPADLVVNSTGDGSDATPGDGVCHTGQDTTTGCTLRAAIEESVAQPGAQPITFALPAGSVIAPGAPLPALSDTVSIDGGSCATPSIFLDGSAAGGPDTTTNLGLNLTGGGSIIEGLAIGNFFAGINLTSSDNTIRCNWIGLDAAGAAAPNAFGVRLASTTTDVVSDNVIGAAENGNVISGNLTNGVWIINDNATGNQVSHNLVGLDPTGTVAVPNGTGTDFGAGVAIRSASFNTIGPGNTISGNNGDGVRLFEQEGFPTTDNWVSGNRIGTDVSGEAAIPNSGHGVSDEGAERTLVGGSGAPGDGQPNVIAHNAGDGVRLSSSSNASVIGNTIHDNDGTGVNVVSGDFIEILSNSIDANGELGIDLGGDGVTPNDEGDGDSGANALINTAEISSVTQGDGEFTISGQVDVVTGNHRIEFFASPSCDASGFGEGQTLVDSLDFSITAEEFPFQFDHDVPGEIPGAVTATVTLLSESPRTSEFSNCFAGAAVPVVVDSLEVTVDQAQTGPGATSVNLVDIPIEAVFGSAESSSTSASPLGAVPLGAVDLAQSPLGAVPLGAVPLGAVPLGAVPLGAVPLGAVTVDHPGGWTALLDGTPFDGRPLQTVLLSEVIDYAATHPGSALASVDIEQLELDATPLGAVSMLSLALGTLPLGSVPLGAVGEDGCDAAAEQGIPCDPSTTTLMELELRGFDMAASPLGAVPLGAVPLGAVPLGAVPLGAVPLGAVPLGAVPLGAVPLGAVPLGAVPAESVPLGAVPLGAVPLGAVPLGAVDLAGTPLGAVPLGAVAGCTFLDCGTLGLTNTSTLHDAAVAWEAANPGSTLAASPLGAVPLGAVPLGAVPLGAVPLGAVPLGAVDLAGTPLGAVPLGAVGGCALLDAFAHTCAGLGAGEDTTLYELAVLLEAAGSSLDASPLGAVTLDQLPLGAVDPLALLGLDATLADVFDGTTLADVENWGDITLGQIMIAMLIVADYPWEDLEFDELGVQDFAATGDVITYTAHLNVTGGPGLVEVEVDLPDGYRYRPGTADVQQPVVVLAEVETPPIPVVVDEDGSDQTLRFFLTLDEGLHDLSFDVAPGLRLGTSTVDVTAGAQTVLGAAPHTVAEHEEFVALDPNVIYLGYIDTAGEVDTYDIAQEPEGSRASVFLGHLSEDLDLVMYRPTNAPTSVTGAPLGAVPFEDRGFDGSDASTAPETLADIPISDPDSVASTSTNRSTAAESTSVLEDGTGTGSYSIEVNGYNGKTSDEAYTIREAVRLEAPTPACTTRGSIGIGTNDLSALAQPNLESLFVVNGARLDTFYGAGSTTAVLDSLNDLVAYLNDPANGFGSAAVVRVDGTSYSSWDSNPCDADAANAVAANIRGPIVDYAENNPSLKYVTIVGSDEVIPFFRQPDDTAYANESTYAGEFDDNALHGSLFTRHILTDDGYGDLDPIPWLDHALFLPELGVGRLVEEPADIVGQLDTFVAFEGTLDRSTGFVSGYDFLTDGAEAVSDNLAARGATTSELISETWSDDDLIGGLLTPGDEPDLASPNAHYDHHRSLPAAEQGTPDGGLTNDVLFDVGDIVDPDLARTVIFTMGCHAGTSVADVSIASTSATVPSDWAQVYGREAATFVANTGYGYGDTATVALSERLMAGFAARLDGSVSAGQAMVGTKQHYYGNLGLYGVYDEKALQEIVFYGLPMYRVGARGSGPTTPPPPTVVTDPGTGLGVSSVDLDPDFQSVLTEVGTYFTVDGDTQGIHYRPIQPKISRDVTVPGKVAKGALITDLVTTNQTVVDPAFFRPIIDNSANEPEIENFDLIFPTTFANIGTFQRPSTEPGERSETRQSLNIVAGQYVGPTQTQRLFEQIGVEVLYVDAGTAAASDFSPPSIQGVQAVIADGTIGFVVNVPDTDAERVLVLYNDGSGSWQSAELEPGSPWTGGGPVSGTSVEYFVQVVDAAGNIGLSTFKGDFHEGMVVSTQLPDNDPDVDLQGTLGSNGWYTSDVVVSAAGEGPYTATLDGQPVSLPFTITTDGLHLVQIFGGEPDPVSFAVKVDGNAPDVTIVVPESEATYLVDEQVPANFRCADPGSGVVACDGTVPDGSPIDTGTVGPKAFSVMARDFAGHSGSADATYQVVRDLDLVVEPQVVAVNNVVTATSPLDGVLVDATVDWGDGSSCTVGTPGCTVDAAGNLTATHAYTVTGVYTVTLTANYQSRTLTDEFEFVVVYDPSAGFVTGGGWIDSPAGAYVPDPSLTGKATFGFVSKYKRGATVPTGNTEFQFRAANLRFASTEYEWLVVSGSGHRAQFKGSGQINGQGNYGFIVTVIDAANTPSTDIDLFRIKIWDKANNDQIVYDNELGASDAADPTTAIGGGSIVIHTGRK